MSNGDTPYIGENVGQFEPIPVGPQVGVEQQLLEEAVTHPSNVDVLANITSDEFRQHRTQWLEDQLAGEYDSQMGHVTKLMDRSKIQIDESIEAWENGGPDRLELSQKKRELSDRTKETAYRVFGADAVRRHYQLKQELFEIERNGGAVEFHAEEAKAIFEKVVMPTPLIDDGLDRQHVLPPVERADRSTEDYKRYLLQKEFTSFGFLSGQRVESSNKIRLWTDEPVKIPVANVVSAGGFSSWSGRDGGSGDKEYTRSSGEHGVGRSLNAIIDYAERETPLPPVDGVDAYVQPNGVVVFGVENSNHRTAAAIARGSEELLVDGCVNIYMLRENIFEPAAQVDNQLAG